MLRVRSSRCAPGDFWLSSTVVRTFFLRPGVEVLVDWQQQYNNEITQTKTLSDGERTRWGRFCCKLLRQEAVFLNHPKHPLPVKTRCVKGEALLTLAQLHSPPSNHLFCLVETTSHHGKQKSIWCQVTLAPPPSRVQTHICSSLIQQTPPPQEKPTHVWQNKTLFLLVTKVHVHSSLYYYCKHVRHQCEYFYCSLSTHSSRPDII